MKNGIVGIVGLVMFALAAEAQDEPLEERIAALEKIGGRIEPDHAGLYLDRSSINDAGLAHLKGLTRLKMLNLNDTRVADARVKKLQDALANCKIVPRGAATSPTT